MSGTLTDESVTVVGAGVGGLAAACYLADRGADVTVLERHDRPGGHAGRLERDGFTFDTGPSWYLMPAVFERFFGHFDRSPDEYYSLTRLDPQYRVIWKDGDRVTVTPDREQVRDTFERYEDGAGAAFDEYLDYAEYTYEIGMERFVYEDRPLLRDWVDTDVLRSANGLQLARPMQAHVADYVSHPKLQQLLQYTLVFLGGAPHNTPALYNLMAYVDFEGKVHYPEDGGIYRLVEAMADLARDLGATIETGVDVTDITRATRGLQVGTDAGARITDTVVSNANPAHVERDLLPDRYRDHSRGYWVDRTYAPSAYMLYLGVEGEVGPLAHHTLVLPTDWDPHFAQIFDDLQWPDDPAYYVSVPSLTDDTVAPDGHHAVVVLVPIAPGLPDGPEIREQYREQVLADLAEHTGVDLRDRIVTEADACVSEFAERFGDPQGTALGLAHTLTQTGPLRPQHRSAALDGLYYTGSFTTPGIGLPMCLISGEHTADAVAADRGGAPLETRVPR